MNKLKDIWFPIIGILAGVLMLLIGLAGTMTLGYNPPPNRDITPICRALGRVPLTSAQDGKYRTIMVYDCAGVLKIKP